ncbi:hypothetical protein BDF21DRAFT_374397 [Thamnidium elegans]|nr:hypothetical protein BDF21DRAFT_374397 [Thamnidium elegans]
MINKPSSSATSWLPIHNNLDSLNQVMDSVSVLSDAELQKELAIFANAQFTYDVAPGAAIDFDENELTTTSQKKPFRRDSKQPNMHSLLNVKLASLVDNNYHTTMTPDAIESYYDQSPDCSPPNGYHSPNPSPPNGFHSPNPTPPNGYHANSPTIFNGIQGIVNPPITFYGEDTIMGYDEDQFMKTMRILTTSSYNELPSYDPMDKHSSILENKKPTAIKKKRNNSISSTIKKLSPPPAPKELSMIDSEDEDDESNEGDDGKKQFPPLTKEDKRRRNTAASARFRVKKKMREQALQQTADEMTEKAKAFENRVHELEREVKWLKALIVEKKDSPLEQMIMQQGHHHQQSDVGHRQYSSGPVNYHRSSVPTMNNNYIAQGRVKIQHQQHI